MTLSQYNCCSGTLQWKKNKICVESEKIQWDSALGQNSYGHGSALVCLLTRLPSHTTEQSPELSSEVFWGPLFGKCLCVHCPLYFPHCELMLHAKLSLQCEAMNYINVITSYLGLICVESEKMYCAGISVYWSAVERTCSYWCCHRRNWASQVAVINILCSLTIWYWLLHDTTGAPCGLRGWKNRPSPFPGRML